jgi:RimJ/RimL family protein N-acetyltransferase
MTSTTTTTTTTTPPETYPHPFQSRRLVYRAINPSDDDIIQAIGSDAQIMANSSNTLLKPPNKKMIEMMREYSGEKALIGVIICLSPEESDTYESTEEVNGDAANPQSTSSVSAAGAPRELVPIGRIHLTAISALAPQHRNADIGIDILAPYQGKGYGSEAIQWILHWGFQIAGLHRIGIGCFEWNMGAKKLYERLGFVMEGRKRDALWFRGGWWDMYLLSMLEGEWRAKEGIEPGRRRAE